MFLRLLYLLSVTALALACNDAIILPQIERRARNYMADGNNDPYINDFILADRWYSVFTKEQQYLMPDSTHMPNYFTCGGYEPIYVDGTHPDIATLTETPVDVTTCLRSTFDDCDFQFAIKIRKCSDKIQYYLVSTKQFASYCFDPPLLQGGDNTFSPPPTGVNLGAVKVEPFLNFEATPGQGTIINYTPYILFRCRFNVDTNKSYFYSVNWFLNDNVYKILGPTQNLDELMLSEKTFVQEKIPLGFTLKCGVRVSQDLLGHSTVMVSSPAHFCGIVLMNPVIDVDKKDIGTLRFKLTVPLGCQYSSENPNAPCKLGLNMLDPVGYKCNEDNMVKVADSRRCGQDIEGAKENNKWDPEREFFFNITTVDANYADNDNFLLQLRTEQHYGHRWWNNYPLDNIKINVHNTQTYKHKKCYSHVDPHMKTADGYHYENQEKGEYLMYRNTKYDIEILEKYDSCNDNRAQCTCGLIVRAGADVFAVNLCNKIRFAEFLSCEEGGILKVVEKSSQFNIYTPIGTWIDIHIHGIIGGYWGFMNVDVMMAPKDLGRTEGLCGFMDGNITNDLKGRDGTPYAIEQHIDAHRRYPRAFTRSWRLTDEENLFKIYKKEFKRWENSNTMYCVCEQAINGTGVTPAREPKALCSPTQYLDCHLTHGSTTSRKCNKVKNRRRSLGHKETREIDRLMALANQDNRLAIHAKQNVEIRNITDDEALEVCRKMIDESVIVSEFADSIPDENSTAVIGQCVFDVLAGNDFSLATVHVDALNNAAKMTLELDPVFVANNTERVEHFVKNSCPGNCTGRGKCADTGECECGLHFYGQDCGIDERDPVIIDDMEGGGLCNLTDGDGCDCFYLRTNYLLPHFMCDVSGQVIFIDGTTDNISSTVNNGEYEDIFTGLCCVPEVKTKQSFVNKTVFYIRYDIALSNDGDNFGSPESIHIFDSECQDPVSVETNGYNIVLKENFCFIDGMCVAQSLENSDDNCLVCDSQTNVFNWTLIDCRQKVVENSNNNIGVILGATLGSITTVALICLAYLFWHFKLKPAYKKQKSVAASQYFTNTEGVASDRRML